MVAQTSNPLGSRKQEGYDKLKASMFYIVSSTLAGSRPAGVSNETNNIK